MSPDGFVTSPDGTELAYWTRGDGPPLVLVHGSATDHRCFNQVLELLPGYRLVAYDRRGHGQSGGVSPDRIAVEIDDLLAILADVAEPGRPTYLLGYSYGALVSLHTLLSHESAVAAAVLYEPPMHEPGMLPRVAEVGSLIAAGEHDAALALFVASSFYLPDRVIEAMQRGAPWQVSVELAPTLPAEFTALAAAQLPAPTVRVPPIRILVAAEGGNPTFRTVAQRIQAAVPGCEVVRVPGLPHFAMDTAAGPFADAVREGLRRMPPAS
jgi:pimeloyl-ACP methyl ester carboxylesterase